MGLLHGYSVDGLRTSATSFHDFSAAVANPVSEFCKVSWQHIVAVLVHIKAGYRQLLRRHQSRHCSCTVTLHGQFHWLLYSHRTCHQSCAAICSGERAWFLRCYRSRYIGLSLLDSVQHSILGRSLPDDVLPICHGWVLSQSLYLETTRAYHNSKSLTPWRKCFLIWHKLDAFISRLSAKDYFKAYWRSRASRRKISQRAP